MLQILRDKTTGWVAIAIVLVLAVPFAFFGVENYFQQQVPTYIAKINKVEIGQDQFRERFEDYRSRMRDMLGDNYDARQFDTPMVKRQVLESLIDEEVLRQHAESSGLVVAPEALQKEIGAIEAFHVDGRFDLNQYRMVLANARMTPRIFEARMVKDLRTRALPLSVGSTGVVTDSYVENYLSLRDQLRTFEYVLLPVPTDESVGEIDDADITAYYDGHSELYQKAETVTVEYVELEGSKLEVTGVADESTLRERYEENKTRYVEPEQRLVSHILIQVSPNADAQAVQEAREEAELIVAKAREDDADFAELAREYSQDPGSSASGGELGWIERGVTDQAFEDALFSMQSGISDPVKGSDGWHVIWLRDVQEEAGKTFEDVRAELEDEYLASERERAYSDAAGRLIDAIYRDPSTLEHAAEDLGLTVKTAGPFTRAGGTGIFATPEVVRALFSDTVLVQRLVSDLIEPTPDHGIAFRIIEHVPTAVRPLEEVREQVTAAVRAERLAELGQAELAKALEAIDSREALATWAEAHDLEVKTAEKIGRSSAVVDPAIARSVFALPHPADNAVSIGSAQLIGGANAVIALSEVTKADLSSVDAAQREQLRNQLADAIAMIEATALVSALRKEAKIDVVESRL